MCVFLCVCVCAGGGGVISVCELFTSHFLSTELMCACLSLHVSECLFMSLNTTYSL